MWNLELYPIRLSKLSGVVMLGLTLEATQFGVNPKTGLMSIILCHPFVYLRQVTTWFPTVLIGIQGF